MTLGQFDSFRAELAAVRDALGSIPQKTVRENNLRERIRNLFRVWISSVRSAVESSSSSQAAILKLTAELEALAALANKIKAAAVYRKRIKRTIELANHIVLYIPVQDEGKQRGAIREELFLKEIPDLPLEYVPNALLGWRENIRAFLRKHPFDKSVFLMVRYRARNEGLIQAIKQLGNQHDHYVVLAQDHRLTDDLYNPVACLLSCAKGLAVFDEPEKGQVFNPNVAYELGMMHLLGRDCRILKHESLSILHADILMKLYINYGSRDDAVSHVREWFVVGAGFGV